MLQASAYHRGRAVDLTAHALRPHAMSSRPCSASPFARAASSSRSLTRQAADPAVDVVARATSTSPAASTSRSALAQIRDSNGYVSRYRTFSPALQPLLCSTQPKIIQAHSSTSSKAASFRSASENVGSRSSPNIDAERSDHGDGSPLDSSMAFGGGARSQGKPAAVADSAQGGGHVACTSKAPLVVTGNAGKGAVANYGKRKILPVALTSSANATEAAQAKSYSHSYSPSTRTEQPLPQHVYFSSPPSSFEPTSFKGQDVQPQLGNTSAAGSGLGHSGSSIARKKTALIMPGQGSQYVAMSKDLYKAFPSARTVWHQAEEALMLTPSQHLHHPPSDERASSPEQRAAFEAELHKSHHLDPKHGLSASGTAVARGRRGWLRDLVFSGDQLELTRAENAQPAILSCTLAFLQVLRKEFAVDLVRDHVEWSAGHGSGVYAALVGSGALGLSDAVRLLRHRGLIASHYTTNNPILFPPGCERPESVYETWAFANAGSGKGAELLAAGGGMDAGGVPNTHLRTDAQVAQIESEKQGDASMPNGTAPPRRRGWKRTQMSGVVVKPGKLDAVLREVKRVAQDIRSGNVPGVATDEVVEVANVNSQLQIVLSGSRVGVSYCCDRLRSKMLGARAVNLPVSGAYHSSLMQEASESLKPVVHYLPVREPQGFGLVSSMDGSVLTDSASIKADLSGALARPVQWLSSVETLLAQGVERFICLGPGRACAHLLSKELAHRDRIKAERGGDPGESSYEVWSIATVDDVSTGVARRPTSRCQSCTARSIAMTDSLFETLLHCLYTRTCINR
ncbi:[acyl-carrier-protein] S-malonyltransferase [Thecaphora frezii]